MKQIALILFIVSSTALSSQIEISVEEYSQIFTIGNTFDFNVDYSHTLWDIGNPGGDNHWDFTAAEPVKETLFSPSMIAADETPFLEIYPTATIIEFSEGDSLLMDSTLVNYKRYSHYGKLSSGLYDELGIGEIITTTNPNGEMLMYTSTELFVDVIDDNSEHAGVVEGDVLWIEQTTISSSTKEWNQSYISELSQNYPNPFRNSTSIDYKLAEHTNVSVQVYDVFGKVIDVLVNQKQAPGLYSFQYDGSKLAS